MKKDKGVTLTILTVTVLIIMILTGVVINNIYGHGSIIENAKNTVERYNRRVEENQEIINAIIELITERIERHETNPT